MLKKYKRIRISLIALLSAFLLVAALLGDHMLAHAATRATEATANPWAVHTASFDSRIGCSGDWAFDIYTLRYEKVGTRTFLAHFENGNYNTVRGPSPMTCGGHVPALSPDTFTGWIAFDVSGGNFNPDAVCMVDTCTGDTILQGIQNFARLTYGSGASATLGNSCSTYKGGDSDTDAGDLMQVATSGTSCSVLGTGNQGDIYR